MQKHEKAVQRIAASVKNFYNRREPFRINHGSTNSTRQGLQDRKHSVDISELSRVLKVDDASDSALVEPNVPMDKLVEATIEHGYIPPVVMEFPGITAGGGYAGTGAESSSFKYGYFNETVKRAEIILGNGNVVNATPSENAELLHGASGAVGSLGITTLLELQLIPATKYVKTTYHPVRSVAEAVQHIKEKSKDTSSDYIDGILFSPHHGAIVTGHMTDDCPTGSHVQTFSNAGDPWYYLHVKEKTSSKDRPIVEYIPLAEYLFRYDRGGFWVGRSTFEFFKFPFNWFTRWWLDDFLHTRMLYEALHGSGQSTNYVVQDLAVSFPKAADFINYTADSFNIWPLWLCPLRQIKLPTLHPHLAGSEGKASDMMLNIGLWGFGPKNYDEYVAKNRELERKLPDFGGMKWLYAHTYYSRDEFWSMFDRKWYDSLRDKYDAHSLPDVWQKVTVNPKAQKTALETSWSTWFLHFWPLGGLWGIVKAIQSKKYWLARNARWRHGLKSSVSSR